MRIQPLSMPFAALAVCAFHPGPVHAQETAACHSVNYEYSECRAPFRAPQLVHQISSSPCIINRTWGFNRDTGYLWVSQGCSGVFADVGGYHYGRSGKYDRNARMYDDRGNDVGALVAGAIIGAAIVGSSDQHHRHKYGNYDHRNGSFRNSGGKNGYDGCHGTGCLVDNPDTEENEAIDRRPQFDRQGNPNFDTKGNYIGCHGVGCDVDPPPGG